MERAADATSPIEIVYYTDPLCCWSWAFQPHWQRLQQAIGAVAHWRYCMGGLLPTWRHFTDPLQMVTRPIQMGPVWMQAGHACGVPIQPNIWRDDPPRSSYPACIAVKCAGFQSAEAEERYLFRLREAVMTKGLNISRIPVLCAIATTVQEELSGAFSVSAFQKALNDESGIEAFRKDLDEVRQRQISRFPALLVRGAGQDPCLLSGYHTFEQLVSAIPLFSPYPTPPSH